MTTIQATSQGLPSKTATPISTGIACSLSETSSKESCSDRIIRLCFAAFRVIWWVPQTLGTAINALAQATRINLIKNPTETSKKVEGVSQETLKINSQKETQPQQYTHTMIDPANIWKKTAKDSLRSNSIQVIFSFQSDPEVQTGSQNNKTGGVAVKPNHISPREGSDLGTEPNTNTQPNSTFLSDLNLPPHTQASSEGTPGSRGSALLGGTLINEEDDINLSWLDEVHPAQGNNNTHTRESSTVNLANTKNRRRKYFQSHRRTSNKM